MTNQELMEFIQLNMTALKAQIISNKDIQDFYHQSEMKKMEEMICHQLETNGKVKKAREDIDVIKQDTAFVSYAKKHPVQAVALFYIAVLVGFWIGDNISIKEFIDLLK